MLFNSYVFVGFFILVYGIYLSLRHRHRAQNRVLLVASYVFYGYWDVRFLLLLIISTLVDFEVGKRLAIAHEERSRRRLLAISLLSNLSVLGIFKYFNFFAESAVHALNFLGLNADPVTLNIVLPVGISFYTFQTLSYTLDIYRGTLEPTHNRLDFALFVSFFPQLVAGPIERASSLLPQITTPRSLSYSQINAGLFLILWGYFKKLVIADNLADIVEPVFDQYTEFRGLDIWVGAIAFAIQIYGDFSGYSDIARGVAKLMGFDLMLNFSLPYFATNPSDFWNRWHRSLSTWFRDYLYIPLGGNRHGHLATCRNLMVTMGVCGLWHGAAWNFVVWGAFHGLLLVVYRTIQHVRKLSLPQINQKPDQPASLWSGLLSMVVMMGLTTVGWIFFRASSIEQIGYMLSHAGLSTSGETSEFLSDLLFYGMPLLGMQIYQFLTGDLLAVTHLRMWIRLPMYSLMLTWIVMFSDRDTAEFIYFQF